MAQKNRDVLVDAAVSSVQSCSVSQGLCINLLLQLHNRRCMNVAVCCSDQLIQKDGLDWVRVMLPRSAKFAPVNHVHLSFWHFQILLRSLETHHQRAGLMRSNPKLLLSLLPFNETLKSNRC